MKKEKKINYCKFCGEKSDYYSYELACYICPECLGRYQREKNRDKIYAWLDTETSTFLT